MKLELTRTTKLPKCTIGTLTVNGLFQCHTLEDTEREVVGQPVASWKIPRLTAIPKGTYNVTITMSNRFQKLLPLVESVPGFDGVRIHTGNTADDTEGCIIVGTGVLVDRLINSRVAFEPLYGQIKEALYRGEKVELTIK